MARRSFVERGYEWKPSGSYILVRRGKPADVTAGGLARAETHVDPREAIHGVIVAVGPDVPNPLDCDDCACNISRHEEPASPGEQWGNCKSCGCKKFKHQDALPIAPGLVIAFRDHAGAELPPDYGKDLVQLDAAPNRSEILGAFLTDIVVEGETRRVWLSEAVLAQDDAADDAQEIRAKEALASMRQEVISGQNGRGKA